MPATIQASVIANNILDALPLDLQDAKTSPAIKPMSRCEIRLNTWITIGVANSRIRMYLQGNRPRVAGAKTVRNYKVSDKGALPDTFWTALREHVDYNISYDVKQKAKTDRVKGAWSKIKEYADVTGLSCDTWAADRVKSGNRENVALHSADRSVSVTLNITPDGDIKMHYLTVEDRLLTPVELKEILDLVGTTKSIAPKKAIEVVRSHGELFSGF